MRFRTLAIPALAALALMAAGCASLVRDGRSSLAAGRYDDAADRFRRHLDENPDDWEAREQLGYAYLKSGRQEDAIETFEAVESARPQARDTLLYLGLARLRAGRLEAAMDAWRALLEVGSARQVETVRRLLTLLDIAESRKFTADAIAGSRPPRPPGVGRWTGALYHNDLSAEKGLRAVQKAFASMLIQDLARVEGLRVVSRMRMDALLGATGFRQTGLVDEGEIPETARLLGVDHLVYGTLSTLLRDLRVNTSLASLPAGGPSAAFFVADRLERFHEVQKKVAFAVLERIGQPLTEERRKRLGRPHTEDFDAFLYYGRGLNALDAGEWDTAAHFFERALDADSGFDLAREALAACPTGLGIPIEPVIRMGVDPEAGRTVTDRMEPIVEALASFPD